MFEFLILRMGKHNTLYIVLTLKSTFLFLRVQSPTFSEKSDF